MLSTRAQSSPRRSQRYAARQLACRAQFRQRILERPGRNAGAILGELLSDLDRPRDRRLVHAVEAEQSGLDALVHPNQLWILHRGLRFVIDVIVHAVPRVASAVLRLAGRRRLVDLDDALGLEEVVAPLIFVVVLAEIVDPRRLVLPFL